MPLIADIIKKYETQNRLARQPDKQDYAQNREDIFLKVEPRGDPVGTTIGLGKGSIWKAKPIKIKEQKPARIISPQEIQQKRMSLEEEVQFLRKENQELKQKLQQLNLA